MSLELDNNDKIDRLPQGTPLSNEKVNILLQNLPQDQLLASLWDLKQGEQEEDLKNLLGNLPKESKFSLIVNLLFNETHQVINNILEEYLDEWMDAAVLEVNSEIFNTTQIEIYKKWEAASNSQFNSHKLATFLFSSIRDSALTPPVSRYYYLLNQQKFGSLEEPLLQKLKKILEDMKVLSISFYDLLVETVKEEIEMVFQAVIFSASDREDTKKKFFENLFSNLKENHFSFPEQLLKNLLKDTSIYQLNVLLDDVNEEEKNESQKPIDCSITLMNALLRERLSDMLNDVADQIKKILQSSGGSLDSDFTPVMKILAPIFDQLGFYRKDFTLLKGIWGEQWYRGIYQFFEDFLSAHHNEKNQESEKKRLNDEDLKMILKNLDEMSLSNPLQDINNLDQVILEHETDEWRKIDLDWLKNAESLALKLDSDTNNTSLVLAIELVESGKVLLFPGDAQAGNWLSWQDVKFKLEDKNGEAQEVTAHDLLKRTVFYKVGHHGSHNATLKDQGLEIIAAESKDLVAMIPVEKEMVAQKKWNMPFPPLYKRLLEKTNHRVIRLDDGIVEGPKDPQKKKEWEAFKKAVVEEKDDGKTKPGYFEYAIS